MLARVARFGSHLIMTALIVGALMVSGGLGLVGWRLVASPSGGSESPEVGGEAPVTAMDLRGRSAVTSPAVAVNPREPAFVVAATRQDAPSPGCALHVSGDGGTSWRPAAVLDGLPEAIDSCSAPDVGFDSDGRLVFSFVGLAGSPPKPAGLFAVTSDDHAQSFTQPRKITGIEVAAAGLAVGGDRLHGVWLAPDEGQGDGEANAGWPVGGRVVAAAGDPAGLGDPLVVADPKGLVAAPVVVAPPDGGAVVAYYELPGQGELETGAAGLVGSKWRVMVARRGPDAEHFGRPVKVGESALPAPEGQPPFETPRLVSAQGIAAPGLTAGAGQVCAAWTDTTETDRLGARVRCSPNEREAWGDPVELGSRDREAWLPQVAITPSGQVETVFYARQAGSKGIDVLYASGRPETAFTGPLRVTSQHSRPVRAPQPQWYGTRLGLASGPQRTVAAWADSRNGIPSLFPSQVVFAASIDRPADQASPTGLVGSGMLAGGLAVLAAGEAARRRHRTRAPSGRATPDSDLALVEAGA